MANTRKMINKMITVRDIYPHVTKYHNKYIRFYYDDVQYDEKDIEVNHSEKVPIKEKIKRVVQATEFQFYSNTLKSNIVLYHFYNMNGLKNKFACHIDYRFMTKDDDFDARVSENILLFNLFEWIDYLKLKI